MTLRPKTADGQTQARRHIQLLGMRLRELRLSHRLTLSQLAELSNVPVSTISKIENGQSRPSLVHAINLAEALNENLGFLVSQFRGRPQGVSVVRAEQRNTFEYSAMGITLQDLSEQFLAGLLEARLGILEIGVHSGISTMKHPGEEFCYVIEGAIRYRIGNAVFDLEAGEYLHFKSSIQHAWENSFEGESRVIWVFSDGVSF